MKISSKTYQSMIKWTRQPRHLEDDLQAECVKSFRLRFPELVLFHIPNGGKRSVREAARLKRQGVLAGVADFFLAHATRHHHGLFIETKIGKNKLTEKQDIFAKQMYVEGYEFKVAKSLREFELIIDEYLAKELL